MRSLRLYLFGVALLSAAHAGSAATVFIPATTPEAVTESGKALAAAEGVTFLRMEGGAAVVAVVAGGFRFVVK